jgi:hypothetical protein
MNAARCDELDYIQFLVAAQGVFSCTEAARCQPAAPEAPAHDAFTRLLRRQPPDTEALWREVRPLAERKAGVLVLDDTTLDKPYAKKMELVSRHWSGKQGRVVWGINLMTLLWTDGNALLPCDFRIYDKPLSGLTKNDHFRQMLAVAQQREFEPEYVLFDSWYAGLQNLKAVRAQGWPWLTQFRNNRLVNPDGSGNVKVGTLEIAPQGRTVHLRGYGWIKVFRTVSTDGDVEHWATSDLDLTPQGQESLAGYAWGIEVYHRGIKQCCGVEKSPARKAEAQRNHIGLSLQAFLRLEVHRLRTGASWYEAKASIIRGALRNYLAHPWYQLTPTA